MILGSPDITPSPKKVDETENLRLIKLIPLPILYMHSHTQTRGKQAMQQNSPLQPGKFDTWLQELSRIDIVDAYDASLFYHVVKAYIPGIY